jgi:hypothetical protein
MSYGPPTDPPEDDRVDCWACIGENLPSDDCGECDGDGLLEPLEPAEYWRDR